MEAQFRSRTGAAAYLLAAFALTLPAVLIAGAVAPSADLVAVLKLACMGALAWHGVAVWFGRPAYRASALAMALAAGLMWSAVLVMWIYGVVAMMPFEFTTIVLSFADALRTIEVVLGRHGVLVVSTVFIAIVVTASVCAALALAALRRLLGGLPQAAPAATACLGLALCVAATDLRYAANVLVVDPTSYGSGDLSPRAAPPLMPDYSHLAPAGTESVFIIQLESVNSYALFDPPAADGTRRQRVALPGLDTIVRDGQGVLFPLFWSNGTKTNRAWESIICGISGNLGEAIAFYPPRLARHTCLPAHLANAGYATVFYYAYFDVEFFNFGRFAAAAGFQDVAYGERLMRAGDRRHPWGYDDCVFYERAFDDLAANGLHRREKVLAYFEVGSNHAPFDSSRKYPAAHPYPGSSDTSEQYVNAVAEQDHCLLAFWKRFRALGRDDVHLFIVPDHSVWVPGTLEREDAPFATWLAYVPPARRAGEFRPRAVTTPVPSQAEIYPTVLELLGAGRTPRSFAFALRGEPAPADYDDCRMMSEAQRQLVVRRGAERFEWSTGGADFWSFRERFACKNTQTKLETERP